MREKLNSTHSLSPPNMEISLSESGCATAAYSFKHLN
jgi:hypothetical protein